MGRMHLLSTEFDSMSSDLLRSAQIVHALWISSVRPDIVKRIHESIHNLDEPNAAARPITAY